MPLHKIQPNPKNPNRHPQKQIQMLSKIIDYQGQRSPIVVSARSGFVVKGHGRLEAIKLLGWQNAAIDIQEYETEAQEYADMVADNKIAELSDNDDEMLHEMIKDAGLDDVELFGLDDYKPLADDFDLENALSENGVDASGIKEGTLRGILIDFELEDYDEAYNLMKSLKTKGYNIGYGVLSLFRKEDANL
jgi:hypothetical protein